MSMGLLLAVVLVGPGTGFAWASDVRIAVLMSHNAVPYEKVLEGFRQYLTRQAIATAITVYSLDGDTSKARPTLENIKKEGAAFIFSLGSLATEAAVKEVSDIPIVAGMVLSAYDTIGRGNVAGVVLDFPLETQFQWIRRILPNQKNIGTLYNPHENLRKIDSATRIAEDMGLSLFAQKVETPGDLPNALEFLSKRIDVLWALPDDVVFTTQTAKHILLYSFQNRIPVIGLSEAWVKAGALYSLDWDYNDIGEQCGEIALKILKGTRASAIPVTLPRKVMYSVNLKTALHMKIEIMESLVQGAHHTFKYNTRE